MQSEQDYKRAVEIVKKYFIEIEKTKATATSANPIIDKYLIAEKVMNVFVLFFQNDNDFFDSEYFKCQCQKIEKI